jgi:hypothetical protein
VVLLHCAGLSGKPEMMLALIINPNNPAYVIYILCNVLTGWVFLQTYQDRGKVDEGVDKLKMVIREAYVCAHGWASRRASNYCILTDCSLLHRDLLSVLVLEPEDCLFSCVVSGI